MMTSPGMSRIVTQTYCALPTVNIVPPPQPTTAPTQCTNPHECTQLPRREPTPIDCNGPFHPSCFTATPIPTPDPTTPPPTTPPPTTPPPTRHRRHRQLLPGHQRLHFHQSQTPLLLPQASPVPQTATMPLATLLSVGTPTAVCHNGPPTAKLAQAQATGHWWAMLAPTPSPNPAWPAVLHTGFAFTDCAIAPPVIPLPLLFTASPPSPPRVLLLLRPLSQLQHPQTWRQPQLASRYLMLQRPPLR